MVEGGHALLVGLKITKSRPTGRKHDRQRGRHPPAVVGSHQALDSNQAEKALGLFDDVRAITWRLLHPSPWSRTRIRTQRQRLDRGAGSDNVPRRPSGRRRLPHIVRPGSPGKRAPKHPSRLRSRPPLVRAAWSQTFPPPPLTTLLGRRWVAKGGPEGRGSKNRPEVPLNCQPSTDDPSLPINSTNASSRCSIWSAPSLCPAKLTR